MKHHLLQSELYRLGGLAAYSETNENETAFLDYVVLNMEYFNDKCWDIFIYFVGDSLTYIKQYSSKLRLIVDALDKNGYVSNKDSFAVIAWLKQWI